MTFRIVIAEDEAITRRDLAEMLAEMGHQVVGQARDGRSALELVAQLDPDIVLLDIVMPGLDGIEAARRLSRERPVVLLTAHSSPDHVSRALDAGVMAYLGKPFREQDLAPTIEIAVSNFLARHQLSQRVERLSDQLQARKVIDRARALLMAQDQIGEAEAYRHMQRMSMEKGLPLTRIARAIITAFD